MLEEANVGMSVGLATVRRIATLADATTLRTIVLAAAEGQHVNDEPWW
jgi:hypothetical protein